LPSVKICRVHHDVSAPSHKKGLLPFHLVATALRRIGPRRQGDCITLCRYGILRARDRMAYSQVIAVTDRRLPRSNAESPS
jgi:hypothetical protein